MDVNEKISLETFKLIKFKKRVYKEFTCLQKKNIMNLNLESHL